MGERRADARAAAARLELRGRLALRAIAPCALLRALRTRLLVARRAPLDESEPATARATRLSRLVLLLVHVLERRREARLPAGVRATRRGRRGAKRAIGRRSGNSLQCRL